MQSSSFLATHPHPISSSYRLFLWNLSKMWPLPSIFMAPTLIPATVIFQLDYCHSLTCILPFPAPLPCFPQRGSSDCLKAQARSRQFSPMPLPVSLWAPPATPRPSSAFFTHSAAALLASVLVFKHLGGVPAPCTCSFFHMEYFFSRSLQAGFPVQRISVGWNPPLIRALPHPHIK